MFSLKIQLTIQFYVLFFISIFLFIAASNIQSGWLYIIDSLIISILIYSIINPIYQTSKIDFERVFHGNLLENDFVEIETIIINKSNKKLNFIKVENLLPIRIIDKKKYGNIKNGEFFIIELDKKSRLSYKSEFITDLRGLYNFSDLKVSSYGAFGIIKYTRLIKKDSILTIFPLVQDINLDLSILSLDTRNFNYSKQIKKLQDNSIPYNVREYRTGDSFKLINWKATAKRNQLMVKELEAESSISIEIIMDTFKENKIGELKSSNLEYMIKICSGIFKYLVRNKYNVEITYFSNNEIKKLTEITSNKEFLSEMAMLDTNSDKNIIELIDESNYKKIIVAFFLKVTQKDIENLNYFYSKGFKIIPFFIETESFNKNITSSSYIQNCKYKSVKINKNIKNYNFNRTELKL
ncbi:MAG: hypothetical protein KatS3mg068_0450 [Candidatus Sericytochromatia bacterium]|nr:MAG: hypothetical protein KatS3mg068_0450 [Candidatus Sericytochromatia bacterium]